MSPAAGSVSVATLGVFSRMPKWTPRKYKPTLVILAAGLARRYGGCKPLAPVGPAGEAILDYVGSDAMLAGYGRVILVLHPVTGPAVLEHVRRSWTRSLTVEACEQSAPRGTADAVLAARPLLGRNEWFAVCNADDMYGAEAFGQLGRYLAECQDLADVAPEFDLEHAVVLYELARTVLGNARVTRGICHLDAAGRLERLDERRFVGVASGSLQMTSEDGRLPGIIDRSSPTSVNLWGFGPSIWPVFEAAMEQAAADAASEGAAATASEVLIPEVVDRAVRGSLEVAGRPPQVRALLSKGKCIGVTHPDDLARVQLELFRQVALGARSDELWSEGRIAG